MTVITNMQRLYPDTDTGLCKWGIALAMPQVRCPAFAPPSFNSTDALSDRAVCAVFVTVEGVIVERLTWL